MDIIEMYTRRYVADHSCHNNETDVHWRCQVAGEYKLRWVPFLDWLYQYDQCYWFNAI